ncbi:MAG: efflux RND transporter periplasmic adaptor subunit [Psychromonas sp.]
MLIVLGLYALIVWLVFFKFKVLTFTRLWKYIVWGGAISIAIIVIGALQHYTPASGTAVVSAYSQKIYPEVSGQIKKVFIEDSKKVAKGDKLFEIDTLPYQYAVNRKEAHYRYKRFKFEDQKELFEKKVVAKRSVDVFEADMDQAKSSLDMAKYDLERTLVVAPADGFVSISTLREGQRASTLVSVVDFTSIEDIWLSVNLKQNGVGRIEAGQRVLVTFSMSPGKVYESEVSIVPTSLTQGQIFADSNVDSIDSILGAKNLYTIKIKFPKEAKQNLRKPGSLASVTVITDEGNPINALAVIIQWIGAWVSYVL